MHESFAGCVGGFMAWIKILRSRAVRIATYIPAMEHHLYFLCVTCDLNIVESLPYLGIAESEAFSLARKDINVVCICVTQGQVFNFAGSIKHNPMRSPTFLHATSVYFLTHATRNKLCNRSIILFLWKPFPIILNKIDKPVKK